MVVTRTVLLPDTTAVSVSVKVMVSLGIAAPLRYNAVSRVPDGTEPFTK